ncbi:MAG TPA: DUF6325 family protein [Microthrixaceae bacterium]|nr:DUF6325 family protein [Microthrixaceae bacterium]
MSDIEVHGPIDAVLIEFPGNGKGADAAEALLDLIERGVIRLYDLLIIRKDEDGTFSGVDITDLEPDSVGGFAAFAGARSGLLGDDELTEAADAIAPGTVAVLIVYENAWAIPFVAGARKAGGQLVASLRIPGQDIMDTLDALEALDN